MNSLRNIRIDKLALHIIFLPDISLVHSMRCIFRLSGPAILSPLCFPSFRRIYSVVPGRWKKHATSSYIHPISSQPKFRLTLPLIYSLRAIASLRERYSTVYTLLLSRASSLHAHVCTSTRNGKVRKLRFRHLRWTTTRRCREKLCIRSLHWARFEIYDTM